MNLAYPYVLEPQPDGSFFVQFMDIEEAFTEGDTVEEAAFNAAEVLSGILAHRLDQGDEIPHPSPADSHHVALPSASVQSALLIRLARGQRPLSELARALDTSWPAAQRLENPHHWPTLKQLDKAARAMGKRLVLSIE